MLEDEDEVDKDTKVKRLVGVDIKLSPSVFKKSSTQQTPAVSTFVCESFHRYVWARPTW